MAAHGEPLGAKKRLDSWKEIAAFFGRDERTVKRWEKERGLPVNRVPGSARGGVFAYAEDLAEWLKAPNHSWEVANSGGAVAEGTAAEVLPTEIVSTGIVPAGIVSTGIGPAEITRKEVTRAEQESDPAARDKARDNVLPLRFPDEVPAPALRLVPPPARSSPARIFLWLAPLVLVGASFVALSLSHREPRYRNALAAPHPPSAEAQDLYLKGRYHFEKRTPDDLNQAVDFFTQAIVHEPGYAAPYVGLADSYNLLREYSVMPSQEAFPRARAAASKAVELDPNSAEAHNSLAFASFWGFFDAATADREFQRAIELNPGLARAHHWYATFLIQIGRREQAVAEIERARQLDPGSTPILADKGCILTSAGRTEEARVLLTQLTTSQPDFVPPHRYLAEYIYFPEGNYEGYFAEMETVARLRHDAHAEKNVAAQKAAYESRGRQGLFQERLKMAQELFERGTGSAFDVATAYSSLGQDDNAMKSLEIAFQRHDLQLTSLTSNPELARLHRRQEFRELVAKVGLPPAP
jgi:tetratricopeptide (TPR) repeat protein